jgi:predicted glycosyltransferase
MSTPATILLHGPDNVGMGHISRLSTIVLALRNIEKNVRPLFAIQGGGQVLLEVLGLPYVTLPKTRAMYGTTAWNQWSEHERSVISLRVSRAIVRSIRPRVAVFDCFPNRALVIAVVEHNVPIILCLRETRYFRTYLDRIPELLPHINLVLIPHEPGSFELPDAIRAKSHFIGTVVRPITPKQNVERDPTRPRIVITGGGGGFRGAVSFYNLAINALLEVRRYYPLLEARLVTGPFFEDWCSLDLITGMTVIPFEPEMIEAFHDADLVVGAAGYNTVAELEHVGVKAVLIPAETAWDDQNVRAQRSSFAHSQVRYFQGTSARELGQMIQRLLGENMIVRSEAATGAAKAAALISSML